MILSQPADPTPSAASPAPESVWDRTARYAGNVRDLYELPVGDVAAVIGVEAAWLSGILIAIKIFSVGIACEFSKGHQKKKECPL